MSDIVRKSLTVNIFFIITFFIIIKLEYFHTDTFINPDFNLIPTKIKDWSSIDISNPDYVYEILETKDVLTRKYVNQNGQSILLTIICSDQNTGAFHPPEICYVGESGLQFIEKKKEIVKISNSNLLETNKLTMKRNHGNTKIWYWFSAGNKMLSNYYVQQFYLLLNVLKNKKSISGIIKVTFNSDNESDEIIAKDFINIILPHIQSLFK